MSKNPTPPFGNGQKPGGLKGKPRRFNPMWVYLFLALFLAGLTLFKPAPSSQKVISWSKFQMYAQDGSFTTVTVDRISLKATAEVKDEKIENIFNDDEISQLKKRNLISWGQPNKTSYLISTEIPSPEAFEDFLRTNGISPENLEVRYLTKKSFWPSFIFNILPILLILGVWIYFIRSSMKRGGGAGGGIFSVGKSKAKVFDRTQVSITFKDVAGLQEAKQEVQEIVDFLKSPSKYTRLGGKIPKGVLLVGPPGTGKTLLAKAVAGEAHVPFFSISGSDFVEMFVGVGASRVRDLFEKAKEKAPSIIFIDEIDAVGRARGKNNNFGGNDERENTLNQLLTEMDGFTGNIGVIVLAATNRVDVLDKALLRAGRFDRQIHVDLPDINDRKEIFGVHMKSLKLDSSVNPELLARQTPGFSGADIANVCNEAALIAARNKKDSIGHVDFNNAIDRIIGGLEKKNRIITEDERESIAIHEAGHATVSWMIQYGNPLVKVTIVPRGKALGAAWYMPEERQITHTQVLKDEICSLLAGRAAEDLFLGRISTGAANDLERVTRLARAMVSVYGMSEKIPNINYYDPQADFSFQKPYSEKTAELIDQEVNGIIAEQYARAKNILIENKVGHHKIAEKLLKEEVIYTSDVEQILGKRQWQSHGDLLRAENEQQAEKSDQESETLPPPIPSSLSDSVKDKEEDKDKIPEGEENNSKETDKSGGNSIRDGEILSQ